MTDNIVPLRFNVQEVGKHVKSSKKRFTWDVSLGSRQHSIVLDFSFISGKVKVTVDRKVLLENQLPANTSFQYPFTLDGNSLNVIQQGQTFELRINNKVFSHLYNQAKTNKQFKKYEDQVKDFKVNQNQFQAKKLTLNIGGVGGGMKKKPKADSSQGHNWNAFGQDQMSGFPNYFQGQSVSTNASTQKVEQPPQMVQKRSAGGSLLDEDSNISVMQKSSQPTQNILDFEAQIQKVPVQTQPQSSNNQQNYSTMQWMFQTMNLNGSQQTKPSVVIDSNQVDFFASSEEEPQKTSSTVQQPQIDFFSGMNQTPVTNQVSSLNQQPSNVNQMQHMFATSAGNQGAGLNAMSFSTSVNPKSQNIGLDFGWNAQTITQPTQPVQPVNQGLNFNLNTEAPKQQPVEANFSTSLQGLFATNSMGVNQSPSINMSVSQQPTTVSQQAPVQANFGLNAQHFATQQMPMQGFGTSYNLNAQNFSTNFMGQGFGSPQVNFLNQQKSPVQQPVIQQQTSFQVQQPTVQPQVTQSSFNANPNDFATIGLLFQTNSTPVQQINQTQTTTQPSMISSTVKSSNDSFTQQFSTMGGQSLQSPNAMFMNTYGGGSVNQNLSFDLSVGSNQPANSMMKKKSSPGVNEPSNSVGDLL